MTTEDTRNKIQNLNSLFWEIKIPSTFELLKIYLEKY